MSIAVTIFVPEAAKGWNAKQLQSAIRQAGSSLELHSFNARTQLGMIPCKYNGISSGFEYSRDPVDEYMMAVGEMRDEEPEDFPYSRSDLQRIKQHNHVVQLVTHASFRARVAAVIFAACLTEMTGGWVLDEPVWKWYSWKTAGKWARSIESGTRLQVDAEGA